MESTLSKQWKVKKNPPHGGFLLAIMINLMYNMYLNTKEVLHV